MVGETDGSGGRRHYISPFSCDRRPGKIVSGRISISGRLPSVIRDPWAKRKAGHSRPCTFIRILGIVLIARIERIGFRLIG